ncbi:hypothetical protein [Pelagicoccus sp. SDUM812003]|uniref:hypothetical protein n=1 Tax=Pelagicoccus sp. SDUM812003 TaxID=3041267 RepID=UPI00280C61EB|nr:hypothetical protein [Pelagicoccus sp. SDUM812003]MDQ8205068.1 hypothetical protein [Pelagicoccus sp. SDUM812003]
MDKRAIFAVKDVSGIAEFGEKLVERYGYQLHGNEAAKEVFDAKEIACQALDPADAPAFFSDRSNGVSLLVANFLDVESAGRSLLSWKSAMRAFDREIVDAIRAAAWLADHIAVLGNAGDYGAALEDMQERGGRFSQAFRVDRAVAALRAASEFDFAVAQYLEVQGADAPDMGALSGYSKAMRFAWPRAQLFKQGENRHQKAALYGNFFDHFELVAGGDLDFESTLTLSRAAYLIGEFERPATALLRHGKVVHAAFGADHAEALQRGLSSPDASGSWLVVNGNLGEQGLEFALKHGVFGILAPDFTEPERAVLKEASPAVKAVVSTSGLGYDALHEARTVIGGALVQDKDRSAINPMEWTVGSLAQPLVEDWEILLFAAKVARHVDSIALVVANAEGLVGFESGHYSTRRAWDALRRRDLEMKDAVAVVDTEEIAPAILTEMKQRGIRAVIKPVGGKEAEHLSAANEAGLVLLSMSKSLKRW